MMDKQLKEKRSEIINKLHKISQKNNSEVKSITDFDDETFLLMEKAFDYKKAQRDLKIMHSAVIHRSEFKENFIQIFNNALKDHNGDPFMSTMQIYIQGYIEGLQDFYCINTVRDIEKLGK